MYVTANRIRNRDRTRVDGLRADTHASHASEETQHDMLTGEMAVAARYVEALLPAKWNGADPGEGSVAADWVYIPSAHLGGDSFGYHWIDDDHFVVYLLDVSGHGVGPALHSVSVLNVLRLQALPVCDYRDPGAVLTALNKMFQMKDFSGMYFTIWYGVYDRRSRVLRYASGGHPPALLRTEADGSYRIGRYRSGGVLIGGVPDATYPVHTEQIPPGAVLYLFSDGAYEVPTDRGMLGLDAFVRIICHQAALDADSPSEIAARIAEIQACESCLDDFALVRIEFF